MDKKQTSPGRINRGTLRDFYQEYGNYNILYNQLNIPSPSTEYAWRKTKKLLQDEALRIITKLKKPINVCDVGCGNGSLLIRLAETTGNLGLRVNYQGLEISMPFVEYAREAVKFKNLTNISFCYFDVENDEIQKKFDIIICSEVLEHLDNPQKALKKIYKLLNNNGFLLLSTPNSKNLIKYPFFFLKKRASYWNSRSIGKYLTKKEQRFKLAELEQHLHVFSQIELKKTLKELGFIIYKTPRSATLFGGSFLDDHPLLLGLMMIFDSIFDHIPLPQLGWDSIFFCQKIF